MEKEALERVDGWGDAALENYGTFWEKEMQEVARSAGTGFTNEKVRDQTPALVVSTGNVELGVLTSYRSGENLCHWLSMKETGVWVAATVSSRRCYKEVVEVTLLLDIYAPIGARGQFLPRMRWALSKEQLEEFSEQSYIPQGPPPLWQVNCLLKHGLNTFVSADSNWTEQPGAFDLYGLTMGSLPSYKGDIPTTTPLHLHQRQALWWANQQENPTLEKDVQFWRKKQGDVFHNKLDRTLRLSADALKPILGRGGLLADDMGLVCLPLLSLSYDSTIFAWQGKTLTMIALIAVTKDTPIDGFRKTTLIVAPLSVLATWESEIKQHCPSLTYTIYHPGGGNDGHDVDFPAFDVVVTNYDSIRNRPSRFRVRWRRIVFDEAHRIRNHQTKLHEAVLELKAHAR
ncbi:SNF2 family N-terminal domain-containing protein [Mycena pura]|uniref:SNF2 family N-terminal domain-containing protein n=1 Tax=Mycena pura TaxID=153505 RepID=A0AAD6Y7B1_9AGAR|nr:SNF2 family N-terminal domain-containing protein [Mycena pura]